ncbi:MULTISPECIES: GspH/FimT family pseudopilin [Pseudomonas]|uniref:GspH/FimT family pseudopilin n=1 Tax=Pseudomonas TaxID=286 RepID=UPI001CFA1FA8|nr:MULTISPECIES: GspH/FimT family pseudopilin [Pseudomonas]
MRDRNKGFSLIELMVTVAVIAIGASIAIPSFSTLIRNNRADSDTGDFYRALNYARLEAINRGVNVRITPATTGATWVTSLNVQTTSSPPSVLRVIAPMSPGSALAPSVTATYIEFNNLGALAYPATALTMVYTNGSTSRNVGICLNGRVILNGACP